VCSSVPDFRWDYPDGLVDLEITPRIPIAPDDLIGRTLETDRGEKSIVIAVTTKKNAREVAVENEGVTEGIVKGTDEADLVKGLTETRTGTVKETETETDVVTGVITVIGCATLAKVEPAIETGIVIGTASEKTETKSVVGNEQTTWTTLIWRNVTKGRGRMKV
jgi:hypothetical protein